MKQKILAFARSVPGALIAVALVLAAVSASVAHPPAVDATDGPTLRGYAWSDNIGWISFQNGAQSVRISDAGALSGYAWSDNIGWIKFGGLSAPFPNSSLGGNAVLEGGARLKGWARACAGTSSGTCASMTSRTDGWDGWISLADPGDYGVTLANRHFGGFAWGSDVVGWIDWSGVSTDTEVEIGACIGPNGELIANGQSRTYYGPIQVNGTCPQVTRTCTAGTLSPGTYTSLTCGVLPPEPPENCTRAGIELAEGESHLFYSERMVSSGSVVCASFSDLHECCDSVGETLTCTGGVLVGADGLEDVEHEFLRCTPAPRPTEF